MFLKQMRKCQRKSVKDQRGRWTYSIRVCQHQFTNCKVAEEKSF